MRRLAWLIASGSVAIALSCATLDPVEANLCGNRVVEGGEDCDEGENGTEVSTVAAPEGGATPSSATKRCRGRQEAFACRYDCTASALACPTGWGCDVTEGICRQASGEYDRAASASVSQGAVRLLAGDFDGDKRIDLIASQPSFYDGTANAFGYFFGLKGVLERTIPVPVPIANPQAISRGNFTDIGYGSVGVGQLRGKLGLPFIPELFDFVDLRNPKDPERGSVAKLVPIYTGNPFPSTTTPPSPPPTLRGTSKVGVLSEDSFGIFEVATRKIEPVPTGVFNRLNALANAPLSQITTYSGSPTHPFCMFREGTNKVCGQVVFVTNGDVPQILVADFSSRSLPVQRLTPRDPCKQDSDCSSGSCTVQTGRCLGGGIGAVAAADVNGDGLDDLVVGSEGKGCASVFLSTGSGFGPRRITEFPSDYGELLDRGCPSTETFIGAVDITGDDRAELFFSRTVFRLGTLGATAPLVLDFRRPYGGDWTTVQAGDYDGDGWTDAIAAARDQPTINVFLGGSTALRAKEIAVPEPVENMVVGNFDSDRYTDIAITTSTAKKELVGTVYVSFGGPFPELVQVGQRSTDQLLNLGRLSAGRSIPDVDFLGFTDRGNDLDASHRGRGVIAFAALGRVPTSQIQDEQLIPQHFLSRAFAFGSYENSSTSGVVSLSLAPTAADAQAKKKVGISNPARLIYLSDVNSNGRAVQKEVTGVDYLPFWPIALASGKVKPGATLDEAFFVGPSLTSEDEFVFARLSLDKFGAEFQKVQLGDAMQVLGKVKFKVNRDSVDFRGGRQTTSPTEKFRLLDADDDGHLDLVFTDGRRAGDHPSFVVVLRNDGSGGFGDSPIELPQFGGRAGRSFAMIRRGTSGPRQFAVLFDAGILFHTYEAKSNQFKVVGRFVPDDRGGSVSMIEAGAPPAHPDGAPPTPPGAPGPRGDAGGGGNAVAENPVSLEAGDFDGDGVEDLAILTNGTLNIYRGKEAAPVGGQGTTR